MDFRILDYNFTPIDTLDQFESVIWTTRFLEAGDFELYTPINERVLNSIRIGYYLFCDSFYNKELEQAVLMVVETMEITSDPESGNKIKVTGRDLKSLLDRRIIWGQKTFTTTDNVETVITTLLNENAINPSDWVKEYQDGSTGTPIRIEVLGEVRKIPNLVYEAIEYDYPLIDGDYQYNGETLYDVFVEVLNRFNLGWEVLYDFRTGNFVFRIKKQVDHTWYQTETNPLIFSPSFENLKNSNYIESSVKEKNSGLITGEGDENNVMYNTIGKDISGLSRKEMHISASDVSRKDDSGNEYGNKTYLNMLFTKAENELAQNIYIQTYEGNAETNKGYTYLEDYDIGDICEVINEWGISSKVLISEVILSMSTNDISIIPTFASIDNSEEVNN